MKYLLRALFSFAIVILAIAPVCAQQKHPLTFDDVISTERISEPMVSPDGLWVAYTVAKPDLAANRLVRNIWIVSASGTSEPRQLTRGGSDGRPQWSPDSKRLAFVSSRTGTEEDYLLSLICAEPGPLTNRSTRASNAQVSPHRQWLSLPSAVYPDCHN